MADKDPYEGVTRDEIREAFRIAREDGLHIHKTYAAFQASVTQQNGDTKTEEETETEGTPPPEKPKGEENEKPKRKSLWWGDRE